MHRTIALNTSPLFIISGWYAKIMAKKAWRMIVVQTSKEERREGGPCYLQIICNNPPLHLFEETRVCSSGPCVYILQNQPIKTALETTTNGWQRAFRLHLLETILFGNHLPSNPTGGFIEEKHTIICAARSQILQVSLPLPLGRI